MLTSLPARKVSKAPIPEWAREAVCPLRVNMVREVVVNHRAEPCGFPFLPFYLMDEDVGGLEYEKAESSTGQDVRMVLGEDEPQENIAHDVQEERLWERRDGVSIGVLVMMPVHDKIGSL